MNLLSVAQCKASSNLLLEMVACDTLEGLEKLLLMQQPSWNGWLGAFASWADKASASGTKLNLEKKQSRKDPIEFMKNRKG